MNKKYASVMIAIAAIMTTAFIYFATNAFDDLHWEYWIRLSVVDTRIEPKSTLAFFENIELRAVGMQHTFDVTGLFDEEGLFEHRILDREFYIPDLDVLPYLDFSVSGFYYAERIPVHFDFPGAEVPVIVAKR